MKKIPYTLPSITNLEKQFAKDAVDNGWGAKCYEYITKFEKSFADYLGVKHCIATSSCTGAMHIGLDAIGTRPGDEIILADTNWIATVSPIVHLGANPVFVDILQDTWCIDPDKVKENINAKTKAVIATHLYGNLCEMEKLREICHDAKITLIEDAAEAIGSSIGTYKAGTMSEFSTFSFHGSKTMTTGEGGILATNNSEIYDKALTLSNHGRSKTQKKQFWPDEIGYKFKMSNVQAAIGLAQLQRVETLIDKKRKILDQYKHNFKDFSAISMNPEISGTKNGAWMPTVVIEKSLGIKQEHMLRAFAKQKIDARVFFWPLSSLTMFRKKSKNRNSYDLPNRSVNLPSFHDMSDEQIWRVSEIIIKLVQNA